jgi:hypothetical protein
VPETVGYSHIKDSWAATVKEVGKRSKRVAAFLTPSRPVRFDGESLLVELQSEFHVGEMGKDANRTMLSEALFATLGVRPQVEFAPQGAPGPAPEPAGAAADLSDSQPATDEHDPVELVKKGFGAEVVEER